jgi:hypothetical protein
MPPASANSSASYDTSNRRHTATMSQSISLPASPLLLFFPILSTITCSSASSTPIYSLAHLQTGANFAKVFLPSLNILLGPRGEQISLTPVRYARMRRGCPDLTNSCTISSSLGWPSRMNVGSGTSAIFEAEDSEEAGREREDGECKRVSLGGN